ncbi:acetolactate synthase isozyme1 large subunit [Maritimibacter sp. 55A14]|uniref:5-guanidino-2-oxopentanoate decarboxylase n=1 Tax=Maritimibacter sp. 55A14 TaxID=2174844 RepID=UPI000D61A6A9|nr:5-guanidino-2-oxopentanoate decarboxylase [Maritimibacter sp. 55A14]PWE33675.1 acetolactate synthase isozyme1 large subunit [Maritimibacter sp. 55A14]
MSDRPLGAQISHALKARGVEVIFGIPGVHNVELYRGIEEAGLRHVLTRHEQGAGFMADGYARATGKPGVAYVITGPGLTNIMTPMGQARSDSVPMLVISSCLTRPDRHMGRYQLHEMRDQEAAAATVTDWSLTAPDGPGAWRLLDRAFAEFAATRPGPKHIQVPIDVLEAPAPPAPRPPAAPVRAVAPPEAAARAAEMLRAARRPLFVFGGGAAGAAAPARRLMARTGAASFVSFAGRGVIPGSDPLNFGSYLGRSEAPGIIATADLVLAVGTTLSECDMWRPHLGHDCPMIRVDIDPAMLADEHRAELPVLGDARAFLEVLEEALGAHRAAPGWTAAEVAAARVRMRAETDAERPHIAPICDALREVLPPETTVYSDMTQFAYVALEVWDMEEPGRWHHPYGYGTLGYGLPAAIGGKIGLGDRPVIAIAGDYGFHYTMQELGVAVELGLNLPILLWDNGKLKEIEHWMEQSQIAPNAVVARNPDFCALARAFGARAAAPRSRAALQAAVTEALAGDGPTLIHMTAETAS